MEALVIAIICLISLVGSIIYLNESVVLVDERKHNFLVLDTIIMLGVIVDCVELYLTGAPNEYIELHKLVKSLECILLTIITFLTAKYTSRTAFWNKIQTYAYVLISINVFCNLLTLFVPSLSLIDENNAYQRNFYAVVFTAVLIPLTVIMTLGAINSAKTRQSNNVVFMWFIFGLIMVGVLFRVLFVHFNYDYLVITIAFQLIVYNNINTFMKIEQMTGLLNRSTFEVVSDKINYTTGVVIIDVNKLKWVNDTLGHKYGDALLRITAEIINQVYGKYAFCFRIGGDEFCVIMKKKEFEKLLNEEQGRYEVMKNLMSEFEQEFVRRTEKRKFLKYGASQGFGIYYAKDDPNSPPEEEYLTFKEVMNKADERMYEEKRLNHAFFDDEQKKELLEKSGG